MLAGRPSPSWKYGILAVVSISLIFLLLSPKRPNRAQVSKWAQRVNDEVQEHFGDSSQSKSHTSSVPEDLENFQKPADKRIVAMVLAGRREFVSILDCYMRRNLVSRGGWLDEVIWIERTERQSDIDYIDSIIDEEPEYTRHFTSSGPSRAYKNIYGMCQNNTLYIKIDDDVVFWEDHTIPAIVKRKLEHPEYVAVSANVINQPALSWVHFHLGVYKPYMPEFTRPADYTPIEADMNLDWRASSLPIWPGPNSMIGKVNEHTAAPFKNHRWLPANIPIDDTPVGLEFGEGKHDQYAANSSGWHSWAVAAQTHYSFFENLENNALWRYKFDIWDYHYDRISINFICFDGTDMQKNPLRDGSDEEYLTITLPKKLKRHAVLDGTALAVHFGFHRQVYGHGGAKGKALNDTDALWRYRDYAEKNICGQRMPDLY